MHKDISLQSLPRQSPNLSSKSQRIECLLWKAKEKEKEKEKMRKVFIDIDDNGVITEITVMCNDILLNVPLDRVKDISLDDFIQSVYSEEIHKQCITKSLFD